MRTCLLKPLPFLAYKAHSLSFCSQEANRNDKSSLVVPQTETGSASARNNNSDSFMTEASAGELHG